MLLDTCALLWLAEGGGPLGDEARARIEAATVVWVCAISAFEIGLKYRAGKLDLPTAPGKWFQRVTDHHGLSILALDWRICLMSTELPAYHKDPCDRFIIAAAKLEHLTVVTHDPRFKDYGIPVVG